MRLEEDAMPDLIALVFTLRPQPQPDLPAPAWWGRAAQALFLEQIARDDPDLAAHLHDGEGPHPYTFSTLMGGFPDQRVDPERTYTLRFTAFERSLALRLMEMARDPARLGVGALIELDRRPFVVEAVSAQLDHQTWAGADDYDMLAARALTASQPPPRRIALHWASPTAFRQQGRDVPLPLPELVFGSLLDRWNAYAPAAFPAETRRYAAECLAVTRYDLHTRPVPMRDGIQRVGAVGTVTFSTFNYDRYWMSVLGALAQFSRYAGLGAGCSHGMGQCRMVEEE